MFLYQIALKSTQWIMIHIFFLLTFNLTFKQIQWIARRSWTTRHSWTYKSVYPCTSQVDGKHYLFQNLQIELNSSAQTFGQQPKHMQMLIGGFSFSRLRTNFKVVFSFLTKTLILREDFQTSAFGLGLYLLLFHNFKKSNWFLF